MIDTANTIFPRSDLASGPLAGGASCLAGLFHVIHSLRGAAKTEARASP